MAEVSILELIEEYIERFKNKEAKFFYSAQERSSDENAQILFVGPSLAKIIVKKNESDHHITIHYHQGESIEFSEDSSTPSSIIDIHIAALLHLRDKLKGRNPEEFAGIRYSHQGMIDRVMIERRIKAEKAEYKVTYSDNIFGEHTLYNENGVKYLVTLRDFENETGYVDSIDWKYNKLGTTKHIMYVFGDLKSNLRLYKKLDKTYPFIEIYTDPSNDYKITWHYPHEMDKEADELIKKYFKGKPHIESDQLRSFSQFIVEAGALSQFKIRAEVMDAIETAFEKGVLKKLEETTLLEFSNIKADLFPYQKEGVQYGTFKKGCILADEMGLGKTLQAISIALMKKEIFGFSRTLIICPASLKAQWKQEIEKFTDAKATIVTGRPHERMELYKTCKDYFLIANYELILRDFVNINAQGVDFVILDEAQRIKNFNTKTSHALKSLVRKQSLILTGTPIENKLIDL
ncbi:MAG: SNF2-related protein [Saprospiraceae bacterium]